MIMKQCLYSALKAQSVLHKKFYSNTIPTLQEYIHTNIKLLKLIVNPRFSSDMLCLHL